MTGSGHTDSQLPACSSLSAVTGSTVDNNCCWRYTGLGIGHDAAVMVALLSGSKPNLNLQLISVNTHVACELAAEHSTIMRSNAY